MSADAMRRAVLMDVKNVCTKACVYVFFSLSQAFVSHIIHLFALSVRLGSRCYYEQPTLLSTIAFHRWFHHHRIKSYGAFTVNRTVFTRQRQAKADRYYEKRRICAHILFTFQ